MCDVAGSCLRLPTCIELEVQLLADALLTQLPANVSGAAAKGGPSTCALATPIRGLDEAPGSRPRPEAGLAFIATGGVNQQMVTSLSF